MNVHATLGIWVVSAEVVCDGGWGAFRSLLKGDGSLDRGITTDNCDCVSKSVSNPVFWR